MANPDPLWGARAADAQAFAALLASNANRPSKGIKDFTQPTVAEKKPKTLISNDELNQQKADTSTPWYDQPLAKGIIDALSIGTYTSAAVGNSIAVGSRTPGGVWDQMVNHNPIVMGVKGAFGDDSSKRTWSDVIKSVQENNNIDTTSEASKKVSGIGGLVGDIALDPLLFAPTGGITAGLKGGITGAKEASRIAKVVKAGGDALGQETSITKGAIQGAKDERAAFKLSKEEKQAQKIQRSQLNAGIRTGVAPEILQQTTVRGFDSLPEKVKEGAKVASTADVKAANATDDAIQGTADAFPSTAVGNPVPEIPKSEELVNRYKEAQAELAKTEDVNKFRKTKADLSAIAKANGIDLYKEIKLADEAAAAPAAVPAGRARTGAGADVKLSSELPAAHPYVETPNSIDIANHMTETPIDRFVKGTADQTAQVPFYSAAQNSKVIEALKNHPGAITKEIKAAKIDARKVTAFLNSKKGLKGFELSGIRAINPKTGKEFGKNSIAGVPRHRAELLADFQKGTTKQYNDLVSKGQFDEADQVLSDWLTKNIHPDDLNQLLKLSHAKASVVPAVTESIWNVKPNILDFRKTMFEGEKVQPSLGAMQEMINTFGAKMPTKESGNLTRVLKSYVDGKMPSINKTKFEAFAKSYFQLGDSATPEEITKAYRGFITDHANEIAAVGKEFAPTATSGRLALLPNGGNSDAIQLIKALPEGAAERYARPMRPQESASVMDEMAKNTEARIINGIAPEQVAKAADDIFKKHVLTYSKPITKADGTVLRTRQGWSTETEKLVDGGARKEYMWTTHSQIDQIGLIRNATKDIMYKSGELQRLRKLREVAQAKVGLQGTAYRRAAKAYQTEYRATFDSIAMRIWEGVDTSMKQGELFGYLTNVMPKGGVAIRLSGFDVLNAIGPELRMKHLWVEKDVIDGLQVTQMSNLMETLIRSMAGVGPDGILSDTKVFENAKEILRGNFAKNSDKAEIERVIEKNLDFQDQMHNAGIIDSAVKAKKFEGGPGKTPHQQATTARELVYKRLINDMLFTKLDDGLTPVQRGIETMLRNTSLDNANVSNKIITIADDHLQQLRTAIEKDSFGKVFDAVTSVVRPDKLDDVGSAVLEESIKNVKNSMFSPLELAAAKEQAKVAVAASKDVNKANAAVAKASENPAAAPDVIVETARNAPDEQIVNMLAQQDATDIAMRTMVGRSLFDNRFGMAKTYDQITMSMHGTTQIETAFHAAVNEMARKFTLEQSAIALRTLQSIDRSEFAAILAGTAKVDPQTYEMARLVSNIFDPDKSNVFVRNGIGPETMNRIMDNMDNAPKSWRFDPNASPQDMAESWKAWGDMSHPYKALGIVHTAMMKAVEDISAGARLSTFGMKSIPVGEEAKWAKLGNVEAAKGKSEILNLIDTSLYYPKEIISEMPMISRFLTGSRSFKNEKVRQWVASFDEFTSALKLTQTVMKPGHHVMSVVGDYFRNALAGVKGNSDYKETWKVIRSMNEADKGLSEMDKFVNLKTAMSDTNVAGSIDGLKLKLANGKDFTISYTDLYRQFSSRGIFLPAHNGGVAEDFLSTPGQHFDTLKGGPIANAVTRASRKVNSVTSGLVNNKVIKVNSFTAQRDNMMRGALAISMMRSGKFKTLEEAIDAAEIHVRKWAPTAKDLTHAESKYVRRTFLYYTWLRGMIPRVVESLVRKPSLSTMPSKAMYGIAQANGLDPASFGDPFDPEGMFPSYYKQNVLGPQWSDPESGHQWGINPVSPIMDVMNSIGSGMTLSGFFPGGGKETNYDRIFQTLAGMTNPLIRSPFELGMATNLGTGAPIKDRAQYLEDMPGPVRLASKLSGKTFNPAAGGIVNRTEAKYADGLQGQDFWNNAAHEGLNWLTGIQFTDYTNDSAMKTAKWEADNAVKQQQIADQRSGR